MDGTRFDHLARSIFEATSRRDLLRALTGGALGLAATNVPDAASAKKKNKIPRNAFGCVDVGQKCAGKSGNCCSGVCQGKKPKKGKKDKSTCVAHDTSFCSAATDACAVGGDVSCHPTNPECTCALTTGNGGFCGDFTVKVNDRCRACTKDAECQLELGPGAACIVLGGICTQLCPTGRACAVPCV